MDWHTLSVDDVLKKFNVSKSNGLSSTDVSRNRDKFGKNILTAKTVFVKAFLLFTRAASQSVTVHSISGNTPRDAQNLYHSYKFAKHILSRYGCSSKRWFLK